VYNEKREMQKLDFKEEHDPTSVGRVSLGRVLVSDNTAQYLHLVEHDPIFVGRVVVGRVSARVRSLRTRPNLWVVFCWAVLGPVLWAVLAVFLLWPVLVCCPIRELLQA